MRDETGGKEEFLNRIGEKLDALTNDRCKREEFIGKIIDLFIYELEDDERIWMVDKLFEQMSYKKLVEQPEFMIHRVRVQSRMIVTIAVSIVVVMFIGALLFSSSPFIKSFFGFFGKLTYFLGF